MTNILTEFAPVNPQVPADKFLEFCDAAPEETVIQIDDEVYRKFDAYDWLCLSNLVTEGSSYMTYETWEKVDFRNDRYLFGEWSTILVLHIPTK